MSFIFDDSTTNDPMVKSWCDDMNIKCGFAIINNYNLYKVFFDEGFSILAHGYLPVEWNEATLCALIESDLANMATAGIDCKGWVTPSSILPEQLRTIICDYFDYGYTNGVLPMTPIQFSEKTYNLWRYNMDALSLEDCKSVIDAAVAINGMVCFYSHTELSEDKFKSLVDYALAHSYVMSPDEAVRCYFSDLHNK